jgi:predicted alpha/beta hydrolase
MRLTEDRIAVPADDQSEIPCSIWAATATPRGLVLLGHGLGVDRYDRTVLVPAEVLAVEHEAAVLVPEIPLHGVRDAFPNDPAGVVSRWQGFWASGGSAIICAELRAMLRWAEDAFADLPVAYFGLSLGTQYGLPFLSQTPEVRSAVLGLFGSQPLPKTPLMNRHAPAVRCPVYFVQKLDDELHSVSSSNHLFSTLGSAKKILDSTPGAHRETSMATLRRACRFLVREAEFAPA